MSPRLPWPRRYLITAAALQLALTAAAIAVQAPAQNTQQRPTKPPASKQELSLVGLQIYTSDGKPIGKVIAAGLDEDNEPVLVGEVEQRLGLGPAAIAVPLNMFVRKGDRIELTLTEAEVNTKLGR